MDKFITITKKNNCDTNLARFYGNQEAVKKIQDVIFNNGIACLHGDSGTGKTFLVNDILLKNQNVFEINGENIKSKAHTVELLARLKFSSVHVIIDDVDTDTHGFREITDRIANNEKLSRGAIIILSRIPLNITNCENVELLALSVNDMVAFGKNRFSYMNIRDLVELAKKARGNIRNFEMSLIFSHDKDTFKTPKNMIYDMTCKNSKYPENPSAYIGKTIYEHGYSWGIIHENYLNASALTDTIYPNIADCMSMADTIDTVMYEGNWDFTWLFSLYGIVIPAIKIKHTLDRDTMRPGSAWTKYGNYKMRNSKYRSIHDRNAKFKLDLDSLKLIHEYCIKNDDDVIDRLLHYNLTSADMDTINHLSLINKLKPKALNILKKKLKSHEKESQ